MFVAFYLLYDEKKHLTKWKMLFLLSMVDCISIRSRMLLREQG